MVCNPGLCGRGACAPSCWEKRLASCGPELAQLAAKLQVFRVWAKRPQASFSDLFFLRPVLRSPTWLVLRILQRAVRWPAVKKRPQHQLPRLTEAEVGDWDGEAELSRVGGSRGGFELQERWGGTSPVSLGLAALGSSSSSGCRDLPGRGGLGEGPATVAP